MARHGAPLGPISLEPTAPSVVPSPNTVTVTATSVADTTKSASAMVTITTRALVPPGVPLQVPGPQAFTGCVDVATGNTNIDLGTFVAWGGIVNSGYTWTVTPGTTLPAGGRGIIRPCR
jgi:hypothetical protein